MFCHTNAELLRVPAVTVVPASKSSAPPFPVALVNPVPDAARVILTFRASQLVDPLSETVMVNGCVPPPVIWSSLFSSHSMLISISYQSTTITLVEMALFASILS